MPYDLGIKCGRCYGVDRTEFSPFRRNRRENVKEEIGEELVGGNDGQLDFQRRCDRNLEISLFFLFFFLFFSLYNDVCCISGRSPSPPISLARTFPPLYVSHFNFQPRHLRNPVSLLFDSMVDRNVRHPNRRL